MNPIDRRRRHFLFTSMVPLAGFCLPTGWALAQDTWPNKVVRLVVGTPAGSGTDNNARLLAAKLSPVLKQTIFVDNKPGAHGQIACVAVKNADKDGYTLLYAAGGTMAINPSLYGKKLAYDTIKDFEPVIGLEQSTLYLAVNKDLPITNLKEMIAYVKAHPGTLSYGSGGSGTTSHLAMEMLKKATGMEITHAPYRGSAQALQDMMGGHIQFAFDAASVMLPLGLRGNVRLIGVASAERQAVAPKVMTIAEQGVTNFEAMVWSGLFAPTGTPPAVIARLNQIINAQLKAGEFADAQRLIGATPMGGSTKEFRTFIEQQIALWAVVVKDSNIKPD